MKEVKTTTSQSEIIQKEEDVGIFITPNKRAAISIALLVAVFGFDFSFRAYSVALPSIVANWKYSADLYSAGNSLNVVAMAIVTIIVARISAKTGIKRTISLGLLISIACDILTMFAPNMTVFLILRVAYGVGAGLICGQILPSINLIWPKTVRSKWIGYKGIAYSATNVIGPTIAGMLVDNFNWQSTYIAIMFFHIIGLVMFTIYCPKDTKNRFYKETPFDGGGCIAFGVAVTVMVLVFTMANKLGWGSYPIIIGLVVIAVSITSLILIENKKGKAALLPWELFRKNANFTKLFFITILATMITQSVITYLPLYMQKVGKTNATLSGLPFTVISITAILMTFVYSRVNGKVINIKGILLSCFAFMTVCIAFLALWLTPAVGAYMVVVIIVSAIYGFGRPINATCIYDAAAECVPVEEIGISTSTIYMAVTIGGSVGVSVLQLIMNIWLTKVNLQAGLIAVLWASFITGIIAILLTLSLRLKKKTA